MTPLPLFSEMPIKVAEEAVDSALDDHLLHGLKSQCVFLILLDSKKCLPLIDQLNADKNPSEK